MSPFCKPWSEGPDLGRGWQPYKFDHGPWSFSPLSSPARWGPLTTKSGFIPSYTRLQPWLNRACWGYNYLITRGAPCCGISWDDPLVVHRKLSKPSWLNGRTEHDIIAHKLVPGSPLVPGSAYIHKVERFCGRNIIQNLLCKMCINFYHLSKKGC